MTGSGPSPLRLCAFAGDIPRPTGARSAPYENLRVLRAFVVNPTFLILVAAVPRWVSVVNISSQETQKIQNLKYS